VALKNLKLQPRSQDFSLEALKPSREKPWERGFVKKCFTPVKEK